jgi:hypothetical protein
MKEDLFVLVKVVRVWVLQRKMPIIVLGVGNGKPSEQILVKKVQPEPVEMLDIKQFWTKLYFLNLFHEIILLKELIYPIK